MTTIQGFDTLRTQPKTFGRYPTLGEMKEYYAREDVLDFLYDECRLRNIDIAFRRKRWPINPQSKAQLIEIIEKMIENKIEPAYAGIEIEDFDDIRLETTDYLSFHSHAPIISDGKLTGFDIIFEKDRQGWRRCFEPLIGTIKLLDDFGVCYRMKYSGVRSLHLMIPFEAFPKQFKGESILSQRAQIESMIGNYFVRHCGMETNLQSGIIRLAYSLNEDNGLVSLPISSSELPYFRPWEANIHNMTIDKPWHVDIPENASRNMLNFLREVYSDDTKTSEEQSRKISFGLEVVPKHRSNYLSTSDKYFVEKWATQLKSDEQVARVEAAWHLMRLSEIVPIPILEEGLADENPDVRWYLTEALQKNLDADAMKLAGRMLWDDDQFVRISATDALTLSGENVLQTISNSLSDNVIASGAALNDIIDTIKKICPEGEVWIYSTLLAILQAMRRLRIDNLAVVPMLIESLKYNGARFSAARVLGAIGASAAVPALIEILEDKRQSVRVMVAKALGSIGEPAAVPALTKALQDESKRVRREVAEALRKIGTPEAIKAAEKT